MKRNLFVLVLLVSSLVLVGCPVVGPSRPTLSISPEPLPLGRGEQISLTANISPSQATGYIWTVTSGGGTLSSTTAKTVTYTAPTTLGKYTIKVETTDLESVSDTVTVDVVSTAVANDDFDTPVAENQILAAGASKLYKINVPSGLANELLYFELGSVGDDNDVPNQLIVYDADAKAIAVSTGKTSFSSGTTTAAVVLEPQITVSDRVCPGPCVIVTKKTGTYYVKVSSDTNIDFNLFIYSDNYEDSGEFDNATENCRTQEDALLAPAIVIDPDPLNGAIETLDDVDCFTDSGLMKQVVLKSFSDTAIEVKAEIRTVAGVLVQTISAGPGEESVASTPLSIGQQLKVLVTGNNQAGPSKHSQYTVDFQP